MDFNFDSEENVKTTKTPSFKVLNDEAKLWISDQCVEMCKWKQDHLIPHNIKTDDTVIPGNIILNPRMLILQRSLLLKFEAKTGRILRAWVAKERKDETYPRVRKYMTLFVDQDNNLLHEVSLHITAKGCFQFEFDQQLCEFRSTINKAYNERATSMKNC